MSKKEPTPLIQSIVVGGKDPANNKIINVLSRENEYAIYEIDEPDVNNRIKVFIDGFSDESEQAIKARFNAVKQRYIEAKGLLGKSSNYGMMKQRIAHTLSTCLSTDDVDGDVEFSRLIETITQEHEDIVINRALYLAPCILVTIILFFLCLHYMDERVSVSPTWQILSSLLSASLGGSISILSKAKVLNFEEYVTKRHYCLLGIERVFLSFVAGAIIFIAIKSNVLLPSFMSQGYWSMMMIVVVSGFSESFVPGILDKMNKDNSKQ